MLTILVQIDILVRYFIMNLNKEREWKENFTTLLLMFWRTAEFVNYFMSVIMTF